MRVWFDVVTEADARALVRWWNDHTLHHHFFRRSSTNPRFFCVYRG